MSGFVVRAVSEQENELEQAVETTADLMTARGAGRWPSCMIGGRAGCETCLRVGDRSRWCGVQRVWRCPHTLCPRRTWTGIEPLIAARASLPERARAEICRRVGGDEGSVGAVAWEFGIGWRTVMATAREHGQPCVKWLGGVGTVGMDKTAFQAACATGRRPSTGLVALTWGPGPAQLLDIIAGGSASALVSWTSKRDETWRTGITTAVDPYRGYCIALPDAVRVLDVFHVMRLEFAAVDDVRRHIQREHTGHCGRRADLLYGIRRLLRRSHHHHCGRSWERLLAGPDAGDTHDEQLSRTGVAARDVRLIHHIRDQTRAEGLFCWRPTYCIDVDIPELTRLARTIGSWRTELLAYFDTGGVSNGPIEATNLLIKRIKRVGRGFRNFDKCRIRFLLYCGVAWNTARAVPIRGRLPRLVT
jgi:transposase